MGVSFFFLLPPPTLSTLFPYTTLFRSVVFAAVGGSGVGHHLLGKVIAAVDETRRLRSEEHTSELQSHSDLVCRLLLEKKKTSRPLLISARSPSLPWATLTGSFGRCQHW